MLNLTKQHIYQSLLSLFYLQDYVIVSENLVNIVLILYYNCIKFIINIAMSFD